MHIFRTPLHKYYIKTRVRFGLLYATPARKPRDAPDEVHKPRTLLVVKKERTMGNATNQVVTPVGKIDAATSHAGNYTTNKIYCTVAIYCGNQV